jgi:hypothetical protein
MMRRNRFVTTLIALSAAALALACGAEDVLAPARSSVAQTPITTGSDTVATPLPGPRTGPGPVVTVELSPVTATVAVGGTAYFWARGYNAAGELVVGTQAGWISSDPSVAFVSDTGSVRGVSVGTAQVTATIDGQSATAQVIVVDAPPPITRYDMTLNIRGQLFVNDTTETEPVPGTTVALYRTPDPASGSTDPDVLLATLVADGNGNARFNDVPAGWFRAVLTPPQGSPYRARTETFSPDPRPDVYVELYLQRAP